MQPPIALVLLQHHRWNHERLLERYMDSYLDVLRACGEPQNVDVTLDDDYDGSPPVSKRARLDPRVTSVQTFNCPICCDSLPLKDDTFRLRCGHRFCKNCWKEYAVTMIKSEGQCFFRCMENGCSTIVDEASIEHIVPEVIFERYVCALYICEYTV
jgi:ariadne-1